MNLALAMLIGAAATACTWQPDGFPVSVNVDGSLNQQQRVTVAVAVERINVAVGFEALVAESDNGRLVQRGRIQVNDRTPRNEGANATAQRRVMNCSVRVGEDTPMTSDMISHEILHCLGLDHDIGDRLSVMSPHSLEPGRQYIRQHHVDHIRHLAGLDELYDGAEVAP